MARQLRVEFEGAVYHVTSRGNQRGKIFWDNQDRERLRTILERTKERYSYLLHAYVFMDNHYHFLLETPRANIRQIMQNINTSYTVFVNRKYNRSGHLFQGRYKAFIVDKDGYLLDLGRYIHLNPVRAGVVKRADNYRWSSYRDYLYAHQGRGITDTDETLGLLSKRRGIAVKKYKEFVEEGMGSKSPLENVVGSVLGDEMFRERVFKYIRGVPDRREIPEIRKMEKRYEIRDVVTGVAGYFDLVKEDLLIRRKKTEVERGIAVYLSKLLSGEKNAGIGAVFGISIQAVTNALRRVEKRMEEDTQFSSVVTRLKKVLGTVK
jgi:putative transposase